MGGTSTKGTRATLAAGVVCGLLAGSGCVGEVNGGGADTDTKTAPGNPGDAYEPAPLLAPLPQPQVAELGRRVDALLASSSVAGAQVSLLIVDAETGQELVAREADRDLKPASNTKLFTTAMALEIFGEDHRQVSTLSSSAPPQDGVVDEVVLRGGYDLSWSSLLLDSDTTALDELVLELRAAGVEKVSGAVIVAGEFLYGGYRFGTYDPDRERADVADAIGKALAGAGITAGSIEIDADAGERATELARFEAPPLLVESTPIGRISHNEFADVMARYLGDQLGGSPESWSEEAAAWAQSSFGAGITLHDGSGLSHDNRASARDIISLFQFLLGRPEGARWVRTLSVSGVDGTLGGRMAGEGTLGRVWGKTGTLNGVIATSGVVFNRHDGRRYLVSILMNQTDSAAATRAVHDDIVSLVAGDLRGEVRPEAPTLLTARRHDGRLELSWTGSPEAEGYLVWLSDDGRRWDRERARLVRDTAYLSEERSEQVLYARVSAVGAGGESEASDVYGAALGERRVLIVDGNDRWQAVASTENPLGEAHDFAARHGEALLAGKAGSFGFDTAANEAAVAAQQLDDYPLIIWMAGEDGAENLALDATERVALTHFLDGGGSLILSGSEIGWHLADNGTDAERAFYRDVLRAELAADDAGTRRVRPEGLGGERPMAFYTPSELVVGYPDALVPLAGAETVMRYASGDAAAIGYRGEHSLLYFGFPLEALDSRGDRARLLAGAIDYLLE